MGATVSDLRCQARENVRARVRDLALDATRAVVLDSGWGSVRMQSIARAVGITRQSLYNEFGTKDELAQAVLDREVDIFFAGVARRLSQSDDAVGAVRSVAQFAMADISDNCVLQAALAGSRLGADTPAPRLTAHSTPFLDRGRDLVVAWLHQQWPSTDHAALTSLADGLVRVVLSYAVTPGNPELDADRITELAQLCATAPDIRPERSTTVTHHTDPEAK